MRLGGLGRDVTLLGTPGVGPCEVVVPGGCFLHLL